MPIDGSETLDADEQKCRKEFTAYVAPEMSIEYLHAQIADKNNINT